MEEGSPSRRTTARFGGRTVGVVLGLVALILVALVLVVLLVARPTGRPPVVSAPATITCASPPPAPTTYATRDAAPDRAVARRAMWDVRVRTTCGDLSLVLDGRAAPRSVASFVTLAQGGYWSDSVCHRLTSRRAPTSFLQCGDPSGHGTADPGYDLPLENVPSDRTYRVGDVGLARDEFGTAGEFFVVHRDFTVPEGAQTYSLIGHVVSGQDVVQAVAARGGEDTRPDGPPFQSISILSVSVGPR